MLHRRRRGNQKENCHGGAAIIPVTNHGSTDRNGQLTALDMLQDLFRSYGAIGKIDLKENAVNMMGTYEPTEPLTRLFDQLEKGREFARAGGKTIYDATMVSKGINLLA